MSQKQTITTSPFRRLFANYYERQSQSDDIEPVRKEIVGQAEGVVLEVGAGNGLNFAWYDPERVERVEATDPNSTMLNNAKRRVGAANVPIVLTQANAEHIPFADATFDCVVCTLVFCSVTNPEGGLQEIQRVLKPGGKMLMVEHVRSQKRTVAFVQDLVTPLTRLFLGNCHWNRRTDQVVQSAGFQEITLERRLPKGDLLPIVILVARR